jgi:hypothetical protein
MTCICSDRKGPLGPPVEGVSTVTPQLWLFSVVMEVIVIGTFFGGTYLAYRVGQGQSQATSASADARPAAVAQRLGQPAPATREGDHGSAAA